MTKDETLTQKKNEMWQMEARVDGFSRMSRRPHLQSSLSAGMFGVCRGPRSYRGGSDSHWVTITYV